MRLPKSCQASVQATKPLRSSLIARCSSGRWKNNTGNTRSAEVCCSSVTRETKTKKHPSGCIVRYRQAKSVRSGARDVLETPGGKDKWTEAGDYKGLTDTAETYAEHRASAFEIIMDDDDDDDGLDAESVAKNTEIRTAIKQAQSGMPYKEIARVGYHIRRIGSAKCTEVGEMKTAIRKSYRSKTLRLMNNTMTDTPRSYLILYAGDSGGCRGSGGWASNRVVDSILKF